MASSDIYCTNCGAANQAQDAFCFACGRPLRTTASSLQSPVAGSVISTLTGLLTPNHLLKHRYSIISQVGKGGMGAVYKAEDTLFHNRLVAVKEMSQSGLSPQEVAEAVDGFKREAHMLADLDHQSLPKIHDYFNDAGRWYLVMDFIEGETLENYLNKNGGKLPLKEVLDIAIQLCTVLDYLHTRQPPIIFRDLKPSNIMRTRNGHVYLIDFGIARHFKPGQAKDTIAFGSAGYAAPEQYGKAQTTPRADIYSLGTTLHQMLTGDDPAQMPFHFAPFHLHSQSIPAGLETLITQMVQMNVGNRPASMAAVKQELQRIASSAPPIPPKRIPPPQHVSPKQPIAPKPAAQPQPPQFQRPQAALMPVAPQKPVSPPQSAAPKQPAQAQLARQVASPKQFVLPPLRTPAKRGISRRTVLVGLAGMATVIVTGGSLTWLVLSKRSQESLGLFPVPPTPTLAPMGTTLLIYRGHSDSVWSVAWSPDGTRIATAGGVSSHRAEVWNSITGNTLVTYIGHADTVSSVSWSRDGKRVASGSLDQTVQIWNAATSNHILTYNSRGSPVSSVAWSPDGTRIAARTVYDEVAVLDAATGNQITINTSDPGGGLVSSTQLAWSPDSRRIAFVGGDNTVRVWDVTSGQTVSTYTGYTSTATSDSRSSVFSVAWSPDGKYIASAAEQKSTVEVWDAATGKNVFIYGGHSNEVAALSWSHNSKHIASGSFDRTVQVWDALTGNHVFTYRGHSDGVRSVAWSPDGTRIASGSNDKTVQVWQAM